MGTIRVSDSDKAILYAEGNNITARRVEE